MENTAQSHVNSEIKSGDLVWLTDKASKWIRSKSKGEAMEVPFVGRLALVSKVIDWETDEGKAILSAREQNPKWLAMENHLRVKFIVNILFPEIHTGFLPELLPDTFESSPTMYKVKDQALVNIRKILAGELIVNTKGSK